MLNRTRPPRAVFAAMLKAKLDVLPRTMLKDPQAGKDQEHGDQRETAVNTFRTGEPRRGGRNRGAQGSACHGLPLGAFQAKYALPRCWFALPAKHRLRIRAFPETLWLCVFNSRSAGNGGKEGRRRSFVSGVNSVAPCTAMQSVSLRGPLKFSVHIHRRGHRVVDAINFPGDMAVRPREYTESLLSSCS